MHGVLGLAIAATFIWLGMVLAISFLEAPLKFRAPGVTLQVGLGIGRLVFRALNMCEWVLATAALIFTAKDGSAMPALVALVAATAMLASQMLFVRPALTRRSDQVLAGAEGPRSRAHYAYVTLELAKVAALITAGALLLT